MHFSMVILLYLCCIFAEFLLDQNIFVGLLLVCFISLVICQIIDINYYELSKAWALIGNNHLKLFWKMAVPKKKTKALKDTIKEIL